ncbi:Nif3-like dinuclear metal center hexameric protein [Acidicapsa dinghuensis]|uniref:Nif3-like dinuclear metal center hexameric protein n=1 Tax=Acidicapsa dinghuensis TaxID=2218256 RepID=A0ABW1EC78_9BACT|nr:Nif3-like dinuclear metal center hexameric protein [Acidicapsa dinghuensis]
MTTLNRRTFVAAGSAFAANLAFSRTDLAQAQLAPSGQLTAGEVIDRIKKNVGVPWFPRTVDNLLTATPQTQVKGIATTMMATLEVVQHCAEHDLNMIVTHETPFYLHQDHIEDIKSDPTLNYKLDYCKQRDIAIFHFHDHWHAHHPDGIAQGMVAQLGWQKNVVDPANPKKLQFDGIPLAQFVDQMRQSLNARSIRVLGDPALPVHNVTTSWGYMGRESGIPVFASPDTEVLICGETREWELVEYCQDSIRAGNKKALIVVGHVLSEQGGMILAADWLKSFISEVPIKFVPAPEPFWIAGQPPLNT